MIAITKKAENDLPDRRDHRHKRQYDAPLLKGERMLLQKRDQLGRNIGKYKKSQEILYV